MNKRTRVVATDCHRGNDCYKINCPFSHPPGWVRKLIDCRDGLKCAVSNCSCVHPENWEWRKNIDCKLLASCANHDCSYKHPEGWAWRSNVVCKFADNCMAFKAGTCKFKHVPIVASSDVAQQESLVNMMGALAVSIDCKYGIGCYTKDCFYKHPEGWDHRKNTICKFGIKCKNKEGTCLFKHEKKASALPPSPSDGMQIDGGVETVAANAKPKKPTSASTLASSGGGGGGGGGGGSIPKVVSKRVTLAIHRRKNDMIARMETTMEV